LVKETQNQHIVKLKSLSFYLIAILFAGGVIPVSAKNNLQTQKDTVSVKAKTASTQNNSMFMNAASDSKPREVSLGLPTNNSSAVQIFEDGLPVSYYIYHLYPYKSWHGGVSAKSTGSMGPLETAMRYGEINNYVDGHNKIGSDTFGGAVSYTIGQYGQHKLDVNIQGPIANGWKYSLSTYQNFDPGSNRSVVPAYKDRHQFYKGAISKEFSSGKGYMSLVYQYVDFVSIQESFGPFVFVGDGSVEAYKGFNLGIDSYRPALTHMTFMDFKTGQMKTMELSEGNTDKTHHLTYTLSYDFDNGNHLELRSRVKNGTSVRGGGTLSGIDQATATSGYTYEDGTVYTGPVQKRNLLHFDTFETSWLNNAELSGGHSNHSWRAGLDYYFNHGGTISSSAIFAHEVAADPKTILYRGNKFFNFNTSAEYYDGYENKAAVYAKDEWTVNDRLTLEGFLRAEFLHINGEAANNVGDDKSNTRYSGFNLTKGKLTNFEENFLNGAFGFEGVYRLTDGLSAEGDYTFTRIHTNIFNYGGYLYPNTDPTDTYLIRAGFSYKNSWVNVLSQINYIHQSNYKTRAPFTHTLVKDTAGFPAGYTESVNLPITYGIASLGWVTDAMFTPAEGLSIHAQFTLRNPQYRDFVFEPSFSDGVTEHYDFSGNNVTNLHKVEFTLDPSYSTGDWRFWLSARYISKQYINKTNSLYFKGRVETFGGIDFKISEKVKLSLNVINILNQKGASGFISSADLVEDASGYKNYLMAGTFIRPFTLEIGLNINF